MWLRCHGCRTKKTKTRHSDCQNTKKPVLKPKQTRRTRPSKRTSNRPFAQLKRSRSWKKQNIPIKQKKLESYNSPPNSAQDLKGLPKPEITPQISAVEMRYFTGFCALLEEGEAVCMHFGTEPEDVSFEICHISKPISLKIHPWSTCNILWHYQSSCSGITGAPAGMAIGENSGLYSSVQKRSVAFFSKVLVAQ